MLDVDDLAMRIVETTKRISVLVGTTDAQVDHDMRQMQLVASAIADTEHLDTYLRGRIVLLRSLKYRSSRSDSMLNADIDALDELLVHILYATAAKGAGDGLA